LLINTEYLCAIICSLLRLARIYLYKFQEGIVSKSPVEVVDAETAKSAELEGQLTVQMEKLKAL